MIAESSKTSDIYESSHLIHEFFEICSESLRRHCHWTIYQELCQLMTSNSSDFLHHIFGETRDGKTCMLPVVFNTKNVKITNPNTWPRPMNFQDNKDIN